MNITLALCSAMLASSLHAQPKQDSATHTVTATHHNAKRMTIKEVLDSHTEAWMGVKGVVGTGEGKTKKGDPCIVIFVDTITKDLRKLFPKVEEGYPVELRATGTVRATKAQ